MATDQVNLFEEAIAREELLAFALGHDKYFIPDREHGDHWVLEAWKRYITPLSIKYDSEALNKKIVALILSMVNAPEEESSNTILNKLLYHISTYYYLKQLGFLHGDALEQYQSILTQTIIQLATKLDLLNEPSFSHAINLIKKRGGLSEFNLL